MTSIRGISLVALLGLPLAAAPAAGQGMERPSTRFDAAELEAISRRGRELAAYDRAAWQGTDAAMPLLRNAPRGVLGRYVARNTGAGWEVVFGRLTASEDTFLVAYRSVSAADGRYSAEALSPARADTGYYARAARALALAVEDFGPADRRYNGAVLPVTDAHGDLWVYLVPAPTRPGVWPIGGDVRYRISPDGRTIMDRRRMHKSVVESMPPENAASGFHTAVVADAPEDTDVFLVLQREPRIPEYVMSETFIFRVNADGSITAFDRFEQR